MKLNRKKVELLRAEKCLSVSEVISKANIGRATFYKACSHDVDAVIVGKIAKALDVPVSSIIIQEETDEQEAVS